jgi:hypothetical protein
MESNSHKTDETKKTWRIIIYILIAWIALHVGGYFIGYFMGRFIAAWTKIDVPLFS